MKKFNLICKICNTPFVSKNPDTKTCSRSCRSKYVWARDYEYRAALNKEITNRTDVKEKMSKTHKIIQNMSERKKIQSDNAIERWKDPTYKQNVSEKIKEHHNSFEYKVLASEINSEIANRQSVKQAKSDAMKYLYKNTDLRERIILIQKEIHSRESYKQKFSQTMREKWDDPNFAEYMFKSCAKYKKYTLPSGNIVKLQGYEPYAIDLLLQNYSEDDIIIKIKDIHNHIGIINVACLIYCAPFFLTISPTFSRLFI